MQNLAMHKSNADPALNHIRAHALGIYFFGLFRATYGILIPLGVGKPY
jgi:hypothetical protein